jgi:hypothetical protein
VDTVEEYWKQHAANAAVKAATGVAIRVQAASDPIMTREREGRATQQTIYDAKLVKYKEEHGANPSSTVASKMWDAALVESTANLAPEQGRSKRRRNG